MENRFQFYCPCKHSRSLILGSQVKPRWKISAELEPPTLTLSLGELHAHKSYVESWACKDQSGASRLILHCSHRDQGEALALAPDANSKGDPKRRQSPPA